MKTNLQGKVVLVTGASKGIGKAAAMMLAAEGARLALCARDEKMLTLTADEIQAQTHADVLTVKANMTKSNDIHRFVNAAINKFDHIDILINNAGTGTFGNFLTLQPAEWEQQIKVNLFGVYYVTRAVLPQMIERKTGDIINISSTAGLNGNALTSAYSASKFGVMGLTNSLMLEVRKHNIRVTALTPSTVVTDLATAANLITGDPEKVMHPEDFAELIIAQLKLNRRIFVKDASIWSTNP